MKFTKISIISALALAVLPCLGADYKADIQGILEQSRAEGNLDQKYQIRNKIFIEASAKFAEKNAKDLADYNRGIGSQIATAADKQEKTALINILQYTGGEESLDTLDKLLSDKDKDVADAARMALEKNTSPKATAVLVGALKKQKDPVLLSGIVNSIAARKDSLNAIASARTNKNKNISSATYIADHGWKETDFAKFQQEFLAAPSINGVVKGLNSDDDRAFVLVSPFVFSNVGKPQMSKFKERFAKSEAPAQAWVITAIGGIKEAKPFIIETAKSTDNNDVRRALVWALAKYPEADSVKANLEVQQKGDGNVKFQGEYAVAGMPAVKEVDATLMEVAKSGEQRHEAIRSMRERGMVAAVPFLLDNIKKNNDRGVSAEAMNKLADDKSFVEFAKIAIDSKDDDLGRRLVSMATQMAKRAKDHGKIMEELSKLDSKADDKGKRALERARMVLYTEYVKYAADSRVKELVDKIVPLATPTAKYVKDRQAVIADIEKAKEKTSNEVKQAIDKAIEILSK